MSKQKSLMSDDRETLKLTNIGRFQKYEAPQKRGFLYLADSLLLAGSRRLSCTRKTTAPTSSITLDPLMGMVAQAP